MFKVCPAQTLLPLQGVDSVRIYSQGVALGYALLPLRGVIKCIFHQRSKFNMPMNQGSFRAHTLTLVPHQMSLRHFISIQ